MGTVIQTIWEDPRRAMSCLICKEDVGLEFHCDYEAAAGGAWLKISVENGIVGEMIGVVAEEEMEYA